MNHSTSPASSSTGRIDISSAVFLTDVQLEQVRAEGTRMLDTTDEQLASLRSLTPPPSDEALAEQPRWVHYPWRSTAVRVLGPAGFHRLRLDRNRNKITASEQDRLRQLSIGVVGLSVGHTVAYALAMEGLCGSLDLVDFDDVDLSNLNRIPVSLADLGVNKAIVAARRIAEIDPYLPVRVRTDGIGTDNIDDFLDGLDLVLEECDSFDVKVLVRERARARRIPVVMETSDRGVLDVERFDLEPDRPLFHGLVGDIDSTSLADLTARQKVPLGLRILDPKALSTRMAASLLEMGRTLSTWPQLGGDVLLGGASVAAAVRRFGLGEPLPSGRIRIDVDDTLDLLGDVPVVTREVTREQDERPSPVAVYRTLDTASAISFAAGRAPSGGNAQPWSLDVDDSGITLRVDPARSSSVDIAYRGSFVALGAAVHNAIAAATDRGVLGDVVVTGHGVDTAVRVEFGTEGHARSGLDITHVLARATNRAAPIAASMSLADAEELGAVADGADARAIVIIDPGTIDEVADIVAAGDRIRFLTGPLHGEMISELRWPETGADLSAHGDTGIEVTSLGIAADELIMLDVLARSDVMGALADWDAGSMLGRDTHDRISGSSAVVAVVVDGETPADYIRGGRIAQSLWVDAERRGYAVHPITPLFLYANRAEEIESISSDRGTELQDLSTSLGTTLGVLDSERIALLLRVFRTDSAPEPSRRLSL
ncbi:Rv1355c family protein [Rhodococcoides yunnanense]|uniref:Rv1355c family protein n=1 Tax=Rhodococcoides yunnanense TaxID=278209 RepID=UPI0009FCEE88|nr:Rv1355c family protein [Rhodococcus yunnanensis]